MVRGMKLRYCDIPFPPYAFRPGKNPHPRRDLKGHHFGKREEVSPPTSPDDWKSTLLYLYGIDLFNHEYYWEAHEVWESLWKGLDSSGTHALFLQALIQLSASHLKHVLKEEEGRRLHFSAAEKKFHDIQKEVGPNYMGIDMDQLLRQPTQIIAEV